MPTTTKMGIVYPSSTDLVKDGATAMGTISTTVDNKTGFILLNKTSFSAVTSQQINNVFSSTYKTYHVEVTIDTNSATNFLGMRFGTSGTPNTGSNYLSSLSSAQWSGAIFSNDARGTQNYATIGYLASSATSAVTMNIQNPNQAFNTTFNSIGMRGDGFSTWSGGWFNTTTSFTDLIILHSTGGTITGQIQVYGKNE